MRTKLSFFLISVFLLNGIIVVGQKSNTRIISFYNLENLFDTINSPETRDGEFTPEGSKQWTSERYSNKLDKISQVILDISKTEKIKGGPSILGVCEVENQTVLEDLIKTKKLKKSEYDIVHFNSPDKRGIDVALLYRTQHFTVDVAKAHPVYIYNPVSGERIFTRDQLLVAGKLDGEKIYLIVNHWPSRWGGELNSQPNRIAAAKVCRHIVDSVQKTDSLARFVIMGDFNDDPDNLSIDAYLWAGSDKETLKKNQLFNTSYSIFAGNSGTLMYRGKWNLFDQMIVSQSLLKPENSLKFIDSKIFNPEYLFQQEGKYKGYPLRTYGGRTYLNGYSDHLPAYIIVETK